MKVLNNGLLIDPHDSEAISTALYKLVSDKHLWSECRRNGLRNIHHYSWPEHCRVYLSRVALCRNRHPQWQTDDMLNEDIELENLNDSLQDAHEQSLRLSIDGGGSLNGLNDIEKRIQNGYVGDGEEDGFSEHLRKLIDKMMKNHNPNKDTDDKSNIVRTTSLSKSAFLRKRKSVYIISLDSYGRDGQLTDHTASILKSIFNAVRSEGGARMSGFILSTALSASEIVSFLERNSIKLVEFDALVCCSGSELYYPFSINESRKELELGPDLDYETHIDYRWSKRGLQKTINKLINVSGESGKRIALEEDHIEGHSYCIKYIVKDALNVSTLFLSRVVFFKKI